MSSNIKVVVRCRPLNSRELARGAKGLIRMEGGTHTFLDPPDDPSKNAKATEKKTMSFAFDHSYWSAGPKDDPEYAGQQTVFEDLGKPLLDSSFQGYNTCVFAYGQTGSGKTYTSMGYGEDRGLIPLTCADLFHRIDDAAAKDPLVTFTVEVSFMEIYNERVRDLLNPRNKGNLRVREHPVLGPYVEDLSKLLVQSFAEIDLLMDEGNKARTVAATQMNETSSRSHSVFTIFLTQRRKDPETNMEGEKVSRISLVDLAGSERANSTGATGVRLKEGAQINKSLTTLGKVISALAAAGGSEGKKSKKKGDEHIPYRDSVLTWLLKDSLGGNSKTAMIAAISPADYEETLSTLRYADQAKKIKNKAVVNEDPNAKLIRELKEELQLLRGRMTAGAAEATYDPSVPPEQQIVHYQTSTGEIRAVTKAALQEQLEQSEKLMAEVAQTWEEKLEKTHVVQKEREKALEELGITIEKNNVGVHTPKKMPHLVNLNEDPLMSECLIYQIKPGSTVVGNLETDQHCDIRLSGSNILAQHCHFESDQSGLVWLHAHSKAAAMVNGRRVSPDSPQQLKSGYRVILGDFHIFRFNHPEEVRKHREKVASSLSDPSLPAELRSPALSEVNSRTGSPLARPASPSSSVVENPDWHFARREAIVARLNGSDVNLDELDDDQIENLFRGVSRLRMHRRSGTSLSGRESRASYVGSEEDDDSAAFGSSRLRAGSADDTDNTSMADSSLTYQGGVSADEIDARLGEVKQRMESQFDGQRLEYEERIRSLSGGSNRDALEERRLEMEQKLKDMQADMQRKLSLQKQHYQKRVRKLKSSRSSTESDSDLDFDETTYTDEQRRLAKMTITRWRSYNRVKMAETTLASAALLKEANIISRELDKKVTYQLVIVDRAPLCAPVSGHEQVKCLTDLDDAADPALQHAVKPCVGVKVIDKRHRAIYIWSLDKLRQRLQRMRNLYSYTAEMSQHFNLEDPFFEEPIPSLSFVGNALVPLSSLHQNRPFLATLPILSRCFNEQIGSCRVRIRPISLTPANRLLGGGILVNGRGPSGESTPAKWDQSALIDGYNLSLEVLVDEVAGLSSRDFSSAHCQIRLSAFGGPSVTPELVLPSSVVNLPCEPNELRLKQTLALVISASTRAHFSVGYAAVEFFATPMPRFLERMERWDEKKSAPAVRQSPTPDTNGSGQMRRPESDFVSDHYHDISVSVQMLELAANGEYMPTPLVSQNAVDPGAFFLHQGLQHRLEVRLSHNSGRQFPWSQITTLELGNVRLLDGQGRTHASPRNKSVALKALKRSTATFEPDGTSSITLIAPWDTGAHDSAFLNHVTRSDQRILVQLMWSVDVETCRKPARFAMDVGLTVQHRDAKPPSTFFSFFRAARLPTKATSLFSVRITAQETARATDIWRADTSKRQLRGEEVLGQWRPRGVSLVTEHAALVSKERRHADVEAMRVLVTALAAASGYNSPAPPPVEGGDVFRVGRSLELWQKRFGSSQEVPLLQHPTASSTAGPVVERRKPRLSAQVSLVARNVTAIRRGNLQVLRDPTSNRWVKRRLVLRHPYLYIYDTDEVEELGIVNIANVHVDISAEMEKMLNRRHVFAVYSSTNSYFFQASNAKDALAWCKCINPAFSPIGT